MNTRGQPSHFERGYRRGIGCGYKVSLETVYLYLRRQVRLLLMEFERHEIAAAHMSPFGPNRRILRRKQMSAFGVIADVPGVRPKQRG